MKLITTLSRAAGLGLCVVAFSGTALADPGNGNGNGPEATPPGQEQKAETPAAAAPAPAQAPAPQSAQGQEKKAANAPAAKPAKAKPAKPASAPGQAKKAEKQAEHKPAKASSESNGKSADAHHHVIICHRTGSLSNPYVVINIPWTAWTHGHTTHPAKNGNADKILKDPASRPGSKDGFTKADCGAPAAPGTTNVTPPSTQQTGNCPATVTTTEHVLIGYWHATGATKDGERKFVLVHASEKSAHATGKHEDDFPATELRTITRTFSGENCKEHVTTTTPPTTPSNQAPTVQQAPQPVVQGLAAGVTPAAGAIGILPAQETAAAPVGGVAGAVASGPAAKNESAGGVLGAIASAPDAIADTATGTLPFTGFPVWMAALIGVALLLAGLTLRRRNAITQ
jgi:hypothetical protein